MDLHEKEKSLSSNLPNEGDSARAQTHGVLKNDRDIKALFESIKLSDKALLEFIGGPATIELHPNEQLGFSKNDLLESDIAVHREGKYPNRHPEKSKRKRTRTSLSFSLLGSKRIGR